MDMQNNGKFNSYYNIAHSLASSIGDLYPFWLIDWLIDCLASVVRFEGLYVQTHHGHTCYNTVTNWLCQTLYNSKNYCYICMHDACTIYAPFASFCIWGHLEKVLGFIRRSASEGEGVKLCYIQLHLTLSHAHTTIKYNIMTCNIWQCTTCVHTCRQKLCPHPTPVLPTWLW